MVKPSGLHQGRHIFPLGQIKQSNSIIKLIKDLIKWDKGHPGDPFGQSKAYYMVPEETKNWFGCSKKSPIVSKFHQSNWGCYKYTDVNSHTTYRVLVYCPNYTN